ncbi:MAG TPA: Rieske 2Fe-2S domain-containing protein [Micromonosporaceae bacterium]|nr:Rieske 2Fe-2S domain-containing protein [Micromonosporaceae bacterium]
MSTHTTSRPAAAGPTAASPAATGPADPATARFELVREGAHRDGVEIVHYEPRFPVPGTRAERRVERTIAFFFLLTALSATAFLAVFIWWPWQYEIGSTLSKLYTPLLGLTLGLTLAGLGIGVVIWGKKLLPHEVAVEKRHIGSSDPEDRRITAAAMVNIADETSIGRRPLLRRTLALSLLPVGGVAIAPLVGGLITDPHKSNMMLRTGWDPANNDGERVRLVREDMTPIRPEDISVGGQITVFPGIPEGRTNKHADSPTLLIHLRATDAERARANIGRIPINKDAMYGNFVAYSKICTHAGCPASLYEQQTNRLLCPCHQSQFDILDNAKPIFGPATRRLPMLPIELDSEGFFVAKSDYPIPVGPGFWERS